VSPTDTGDVLRRCSKNAKKSLIKAVFRKMKEATDSWLLFVIALLATWRLSHLLANEDGPADIIFKLRKNLVDSFFGKLMDCFGCVSLWVALPLALFVTTEPVEFVVAWLALSGGAMLLDRIRPEPEIIQTRIEPLEGEQPDDVLR
jgi:hypothetical protein